MTTSPGISTPTSPCTASAGCRNSAGEPVELSVAAIFCAMMPLLPMPVTTTRPFDSPQSRIMLDGARKRLGHRPIKARGQRLKRGGLGAHQRRGLEPVRRFLMVLFGLRGSLAFHANSLGQGRAVSRRAVKAAQAGV